MCSQFNKNTMRAYFNKREVFIPKIVKKTLSLFEHITIRQVCWELESLSLENWIYDNYEAYHAQKKIIASLV